MMKMIRIRIIPVQMNKAKQSKFDFFIQSGKLSSLYFMDSSLFCLSETKKAVLPSASSILLNGNSNTGQVFNNPYKKAEYDQIASLEKHVKMVCVASCFKFKHENGQWKIVN